MRSFFVKIHAAVSREDESEAGEEEDEEDEDAPEPELRPIFERSASGKSAKSSKSLKSSRGSGGGSSSAGGKSSEGGSSDQVLKIFCKKNFLEGLILNPLDLNFMDIL